MEKSEIENLVKKAQKNCEKSFAQIFDFFFEKIFKYVDNRVEKSETEDLVSEIFLRVTRNLKKYFPKKNAGFSSWIFRIAHNAVIDFYRKKQEFFEFDDENLVAIDENLSPNYFANKNFDTKKMQNLLQKLSPKYREILELKFLENFSNLEVAKITGKSVGNVRITQMRALKEMKKMWGIF